MIQIDLMKYIFEIYVMKYVSNTFDEVCFRYIVPNISNSKKEIFEHCYCLSRAKPSLKPGGGASIVT
jgi:hypothetical protein